MVMDSPGSSTDGSHQFGLFNYAHYVRGSDGCKAYKEGWPDTASRAAQVLGVLGFAIHTIALFFALYLELWRRRKSADNKMLCLLRVMIGGSFACSTLIFLPFASPVCTDIPAASDFECTLSVGGILGIVNSILLVATLAMSLVLYSESANESHD